MAAIEDLLEEVRQAWRPPKKMTLSEWADKHAYLSAESAAQEGPWRTLSYQRGIMDAMTDPTLERVVFMKSARVGFTKCLNNLVAYHMHQDPCPIMVVQPTIDDAEGYSKEEIAPMLRDTPCLKGLVADAKSRDTNNTIRNKSFPGGVLSLVGANSPGGFRRVSRRVVLFDEIDGYPPSAGAEGDQIKLGMRRAEYYWNRKIVMGSTPTIDGVSRVQRAFAETDQRRYFVPCPHCGTLQFLKWQGLKWPNRKPLEAVYLCEHCEEPIRHSQKYDMLEAGVWTPTAEGLPGVAGFHIWAAYSYSPNATWGQLASEWLEAQGNPEALKTFVNTVQGEAWKEQGDKVGDTILEQRAKSSDYESDPLPDGVVLLTAGTDVQGDRLETEIVGWGSGEETWSIDYIVTRGDPTQDELWRLHDMNVLQRVYSRSDGIQLRVARCCVDTGGSSTAATYDQVRARLDGGVLLAAKGRGGEGLPIIGAPTRSNLGKIPLFPIGTFTAKDLVMGRLKIEEPGPGHCHFPARYASDEFLKTTGVRFFKGMASEEVRTKINNKGFTVREFFKIYERNEPLDCRVLATAAFASLNIRIDDLVEMMNNPVAHERQLRGEMVPAT